MALRFKPNPSLDDEMGNDPAMRRVLLGASIGVRKGIAANLPGRGASGRTAGFSRRAYAEVEGAGREVHGVVGTRWRLGHIIEFGSVHNPAYSPLRKSVLQSGMRFAGGGAG
jgi:hypothetical protein